MHCSDGWDRTPQISALAQMMIDPFFRTLRGFQVVVEKECCLLGHKFTLLLSLSTRSGSLALSLSRSLALSLSLSLALFLFFLPLSPLGHKFTLSLSLSLAQVVVE